MASIHEILADVQLFKNDRSSVAASETLSGKKTVLVYFSAHWCPPCRSFTPKLKNAYETELKAGNVEIIFVSSDQTEDAAFDYMVNDHGDYFMVPHNSEAANKLKSLCELSGIPTLSMFDGESGKLKNKEVDDAIHSGKFSAILN